MISGLMVAAAVIALDQLSKWLVYTEVSSAAPLILCKYFSIVRVFNTGVSFSLFDNYGSLGTLVLCVISLIVCGGLLYWLHQEPNRLRQLCLGMIIGGALGNVIDRLHYGAVVDFLDFHIGAYHWPAFNVADSFICVGAVMLMILELMTSYKKGISRK